MKQSPSTIRAALFDDDESVQKSNLFDEANSSLPNGNSPGKPALRTSSFHNRRTLFADSSPDARPSGILDSNIRGILFNDDNDGDASPDRKPLTKEPHEEETWLFEPAGLMNVSSPTSVRVVGELFTEAELDDPLGGVGK
jgi:hypothetical protein